MRTCLAPVFLFNRAGSFLSKWALANSVRPLKEGKGSGGWTQIRTGDTRIFSPLLYRLSYPASHEGRHCRSTIGRAASVFLGIGFGSCPSGPSVESSATARTGLLRVAPASRGLFSGSRRKPGRTEDELVLLSRHSDWTFQTLWPRPKGTRGTQVLPGTELPA